MTEKEQVIEGRRWNQPAVQAHRVTAGKPDILKWEVKVLWRLFNSGVRKKDLAFHKPVPTTAKKTQEKHPH